MGAKGSGPESWARAARPRAGSGGGGASSSEGLGVVGASTRTT
eukprot:CAMPEP_0197504062 /NCGR_PEP_ID=MMETSP1312-20131121/3204_1 /TAXON_ID=464262 /ORGANISM="Genus nov. species nov., Strain RCC2335" /LENGTH=42 /DNA_ID= /DNA_START= /DNA_END= /DNA_ORIENTATION=